MIVRKVKNSAGNISVQVGNYKGHSFRLVAHLGSARNEFELQLLLKKADQLLISNNQYQLLPEAKVRIGYRHVYAYKVLEEYFSMIFPQADELFKNMVKSISDTISITRCTQQFLQITIY